MAITQKKQKSEEQKWLESVQRKLKKYISSPYWDCINLPDSFYSIISIIMQTNNVKHMSPCIDERVTDMILNKIEKEFKNIKQTNKCK